MIRSFLLFLALAGGVSEGQSLAWSKPIGNADRQTLQVMRTDSGGNIFLFGTFKYSYPSENAGAINAYGGNDVFLHKLDPSGKTVWFRKMGSGYDNDHAYDMDIDSAGNVYVLGELYKDMGAELMGLQSEDSRLVLLNTEKGGNLFIAKYDPAGKVLWIRQFQKGAQASLRQIRVGNGKAIVTGNFRYRARFMGEPDSVVSDRHRGFLAELGGDGTPLSIKVVDSVENVSLLRLDPRGNRYLSLLSDYGKAIVEKRDAAGVTRWRRKLQNDSTPGSIAVRDIVWDRSGNAYVGGEFSSYHPVFRLDDGRDTTLFTSGQSEFYLIKLDTAGRMKWLLTGLEGLARISNMTLAPDNSLNFLVSLSGRALKLDLDGRRQFDIRARSGLSEDFTSCTALDRSGSVLYAFSFSDSLTLLGQTFVSKGQQDILIFKIDPNSTAASERPVSSVSRLPLDRRQWWRDYAPDGRKRAARP